MRFLFRADASVAIGSGHVVRCATLADVLRRRGHAVEFVSARLPGDLIGWLDGRGITVTAPQSANRAPGEDGERADARMTATLLGGRRFDWLVVDHYGLGAAWERAMAAVAGRVLAIDDLGRAHTCDALLDQNYTNPMHARYRETAVGAALLLGPRYALVRPEFCAARAGALARRRGDICRVLVFMGGGDPGNETTKALDGIARCGRTDMAVDVVIGASHPGRTAVEQACACLPQGRLHVQTERMAELMAAADLAVCAGGSSTWERCVLGLPALVTVLSEDQAPIAKAMAAAGAQRVIGRSDAVVVADYADALWALDAAGVFGMSQAAASVCDGLGAERLAAFLVGEAEIDASVAMANDVHA